MSAAIAFHLRGLTLFMWAGVLLGFFFSGRLPSYLHPSFRLYVPIAGFILLALAVSYYLLREHDRSGDAHNDNDCGGCAGGGDKLTLGAVLAFLVVVLPVVTAKMVSPGEFSSVAMLNRWSIQSSLPPRSPSERIAALAPGGDIFAGDGIGNFSDYLDYDEAGRIRAEVIDLMFGIEDEFIRRDLDGREVVVVGQFMPADTKDPGGARFRLARMFMWCCAADSRPISILVEGASDASPGAWVKVTGRAAFPVEGGERLATIVAESVEPTQAPAESLLY